MRFGRMFHRLLGVLVRGLMVAFVVVRERLLSLLTNATPRRPTATASHRRWN